MKNQTEVFWFSRVYYIYLQLIGVVWPYRCRSGKLKICLSFSFSVKPLVFNACAYIMQIMHISILPLYVIYYIDSVNRVFITILFTCTRITIASRDDSFTCGKRCDNNNNNRYHFKRLFIGNGFTRIFVQLLNVHMVNRYYKKF